MADRGPVLRTVTSAARDSPKPLGVVEFPPPARPVGSGLHVGAMWLWHDVDPVHRSGDG
ncbi:hypothetical protein [Streptomyces sp. NPDC049590]|uniref:hypothetical protein n=1 Tax=Streptomyces sp. NPDC049590 TaxID=3154834 RepID=UPI00341830B5